MHTVIVSPDLVGPIKNGGIGTFVWHWARLLKSHHQQVTLLFTSPSEVPQQKWRRLYEALDVLVIEVKEPPPRRNAHGDWWFIRRSEAVSHALPADADIVYLQDWHGNGFHPLRMRRLQGQKKPVFVTVLHSNSAWIRAGMQKFPTDTYHDMSLDFVERYSVEHSDFLAAPSRYMLEWVHRHHWKLPPSEHIHIVGLPFLPSPELPLVVQTEKQRFKRLVFFGRLETRKGFDLFVEGLLLLNKKDRRALAGIEEIVFLGKEGDHQFETAEKAASHLQQATHISVIHLTDYDSKQAQQYLLMNAGDALVVIASLTDNFPYAVIESSLIGGIQLLYAATGGIPEILPTASPDCFFAPYLQPFTEKLAKRLHNGINPAEKIAAYEWEKHNQRWLDFHRQVSLYCQAQDTAPILTDTPVIVSKASASKSVDVCIPHFNHGKYLPQLLDALAHQTTDDFNVYVVDDASTDEESTRVFAEMQARYQHMGWAFFSNQENVGLSQTRNSAAGYGKSPYLLFVDADNVPLPTMLARFLDSIRHSGDDCLTCYMRGFEGETPPYSLQGGFAANQTTALYHYLPLGNCAELGLFANGFGDANFIIKRDVFTALGGFSLDEPHYRYLGYEDYALLAKLSLQGYRLDVIPEVLFYYRHLPDSLFRTTSFYQNTMRVQQVYFDHLSQSGLHHLVPLVHGIHLRAENRPGTINSSDPRWLATHVPWYSLRDAFWYKIRKHLKKVLPIAKHNLPKF